MNEQTRIITEAQWEEYQDLKEESRKLRMAFKSIEVEKYSIDGCITTLKNISLFLEKLFREF
jgi:ATP-dependent Clp protease ATP-binding subunit ClpA